jgi:hypothetical protein
MDVRNFRLQKSTRIRRAMQGMGTCRLRGHGQQKMARRNDPDGHLEQCRKMDLTKSGHFIAVMAIISLDGCSAFGC